MPRFRGKRDHEEDPEKLSYPSYRISIFGDSKVGKTELIHRFLTDERASQKTILEKKKHNNQHSKQTLEPFTFNPYIPTVEDFYEFRFQRGNITIGLELVDTSGGEQFPAMRRLNIQRSDLVIIMYDVSLVSTMKEAVRLYEFARDTRSPESGQMIIFLGGKSDLISLEAGDCTVFHNKLIKAGVREGDSNIRSLACSSKTGFNVRNLFEIGLEEQFVTLHRRQNSLTPSTSFAKKHSLEVFVHCGNEEIIDTKKDDKKKKVRFPFRKICKQEKGSR